MRHLSNAVRSLSRSLVAASLVGLVVWVPVWVPEARASENTVEVDALTPSGQHKRATRVILDLMSRYHYRKADVDDDLSSKMLDRYLKTLDPSRSFLLASDVEEFEPYRDQLDDALRNAQLSVAFDIFKRFRTRMAERAAYASSLLQQPFDFTRAETYRFDREGAPWPANRAELDDLWRKRVKNDVLELKLAARTDEQIIDTLQKRYERMGRRVSQLNANDVYQFFINSYTVSVEPHTAYFSPRTSENFKIRMSLSLEGIGAALQTENEYTVVRRIISGGPADLSKELQVDDRIVGVGQGPEADIVDVISWRLEDVVDLIRGPKNTLVRLQVLPAKALPGEPARTIALTRDKINLEERAAKSSVVEIGEGTHASKVGVINVPTFYLDSAGRARGLPNYRSTTRDVRRLVKALEDDGVAGIIIDLRGNSGGSLVEATELTGLFIESGPVVQIKDSHGRMQINRDPDPGIAYRGPLAVLVDRRSASASEIFSGAIQDYERGIILGEPTFGKGTVQNLFDLDRRGGLGQLKVTIAQFFRINGEGTQHRGVVPDILFPTVAPGEEHGERALENALPWAAIRPARYKPLGANPGDYANALSRHTGRIRDNPRFKLLLEELESQRQVREMKTVSLVESERKVEWERRRDERETRNTQLRALLGLPPAPKTPEGASESDEGEQADTADGNDADIVLREAAQILVDVIGMRVRPAHKVADSTPR